MSTATNSNDGENMNQDIKSFSQTSAWQPLKAENITFQQIKPGDHITPDQTFKTSNTNVVLFTQGKEYAVLEYSTAYSLGLLVQSDLGKWTITCDKDKGIGNHFYWKKMSMDDTIYLSTTIPAIQERNPKDSQLVCPYCQTRGHVNMNLERYNLPLPDFGAFDWLLALLTAGVWFLIRWFTDWLSGPYFEWRTMAKCDNCGQIWRLG
jgi:hypothetical protein